MKFIGREEELKSLEKIFGSDGFSLTVIYGRRHIGKSELVKKALKDSGVKGIYYECLQAAQASNAALMGDIISEALVLPPQDFTGMEQVFNRVFELSEKEKLTLVLDEFQNLKAAVKGLEEMLLTLIEKNKCTSRLALVILVSGSEPEENALAGKADIKINLKQMDPDTASGFYPNFSAEDKTKIYSVFGGMPYYNRYIDDSLSVKENIIRLVVSPGAPLLNEIPDYLNEGIAKPANAGEVLDALARGLVKYSDILSKSNVSSGPTLVDVTERLIDMELVEKTIQEDSGSNKKKAEYCICDNLTQFYFKYIFKNTSRLQTMEADAFYKKFIKKDIKAAEKKKGK